MENFLMNKLFIYGAVLGLCSVIMGAAADHMISLTPDKSESLETAIRYNMLYAVLIVLLSLINNGMKLKQAGWIFAIGVSLFSFGIYASLFSGIGAFVYLTPVGGMVIMLGWIVLIAKGLRAVKQEVVT